MICIIYINTSRILNINVDSFKIKRKFKKLLIVQCVNMMYNNLPYLKSILNVKTQKLICKNID